MRTNERIIEDSITKLPKNRNLELFSLEALCIYPKNIFWLI